MDATTEIGEVLLTSNYGISGKQCSDSRPTAPQPRLSFRPSVKSAKVLIAIFIGLVISSNVSVPSVIFGF